MKYRIFTNDVGPNAYSALCEVSAESLREAKAKAQIVCRELPSRHNLKVLVIPNDRRDLWPDGKTGKISADARPFIVGRGEFR
jgi:hypothetical protein